MQRRTYTCTYRLICRWGGCVCQVRYLFYVFGEQQTHKSFIWRHISLEAAVSVSRLEKKISFKQLLAWIAPSYPTLLCPHTTAEGRKVVCVIHISSTTRKPTSFGGWRVRFLYSRNRSHKPDKEICFTILWVLWTATLEVRSVRFTRFIVSVMLHVHRTSGGSADFYVLRYRTLVSIIITCVWDWVYLRHWINLLSVGKLTVKTVITDQTLNQHACCTQYFCHSFFPLLTW